MRDASFDRWVTRLASDRIRPSRRRLLGSGVAGGVVAATMGAGRGRAASLLRAQADADCSLGCTDSVCGQVPKDCTLFPKDNVWNAAVDTLPVDANSDAYIASLGLDTGLHPDFGAGLYEGQPFGIPFVRATADQAAVAVTFEVSDESDAGPYPIPADAPIENGACGTGDRHVIVVQEQTCELFELYNAMQQPDGSWTASSGARFDLTANDLRPADWTSADAAGLPILPGLVRYEEIVTGKIAHALRFTASQTRDSYVWPARHQAGATSDENVAQIGQRFRLKADIDIGGFSPANQVILKALKTYGMFLADNGSDWFLTGSPDDRWSNDDLHALQEGIHGADFEAVDCSSLIRDPDSGQVA